MLLIEQTVHPRRFLKQALYWFACPVGGCNQRYDMGHGYYTLIHSKLDYNPNNNHVLSARFAFMWLSSEQHWQIRYDSAQTKIVRLTRGGYEVPFGFKSETLSQAG